MSVKTNITMQWKIFPTDYLDGYEGLLDSHFKATIENGEIVISFDVYESIIPQEEQKKAQEKLINYLTSISIIDNSKGTFSIHPLSLVVESEGNRHVYAQLGSGSYVLTSTGVDFYVTDKDGVEYDSKKERMLLLLELAELIGNYGDDDVAAKILESYKKAIEHVEKSLLYIYEIREAVKNRFGNKDKAIRDLNITLQQWSDFGKLANDPTIRQGRHYWKIPLLSRDISCEEKDQAFAFGKVIIVNYLRFLKNNP